MNPDPLDSLDAFYQECHVAPVPDSLAGTRPPHWTRWLIPAGGLGLGFAIALAIVAAPSKANDAEAVNAARALARSRYRQSAPPARKMGSETVRRTRWSV